MPKELKSRWINPAAFLLSGVSAERRWPLKKCGVLAETLGELGRADYPLLFDRHCQPKPAFDAVLKAGRE